MPEQKPEKSAILEFGLTANEAAEAFASCSSSEWLITMQLNSSSPCSRSLLMSSPSSWSRSARVQRESTRDFRGTLHLDLLLDGSPGRVGRGVLLFLVRALERSDGADLVGQHGGARRGAEAGAAAFTAAGRVLLLFSRASRALDCSGLTSPFRAWSSRQKPVVATAAAAVAAAAGPRRTPEKSSGRCRSGRCRGRQAQRGRAEAERQGATRGTSVTHRLPGGGSIGCWASAAVCRGACRARSTVELAAALFAKKTEVSFCWRARGTATAVDLRAVAAVAAAVAAARLRPSRSSVACTCLEGDGLQISPHTGRPAACPAA